MYSGVSNLAAVVVLADSASSAGSSSSVSSDSGSVSSRDSTVLPSASGSSSSSLTSSLSSQQTVSSSTASSDSGSYVSPIPDKPHVSSSRDELNSRQYSDLPVSQMLQDAFASSYSPFMVLASGGGGADTQSEWDRLVKRVDDLYATVNSMYGMFTTAFDYMKGIDRTNASQDGALKDLYNMSDTAFAYMRGIDTKNAAQDKSIGDLYSLSSNAFSQIKTVQNSIGDLYSLSSNAFSQIKGVQGSVGDLYSLSKNAFSQIKGTQDSIGDLYSLSKNAFSQIAGVQDKNKAQDGSIGDLYSLSSNAFSQIKGVQDKNKEQDGSLGDLYGLSANAFSQIKGTQDVNVEQAGQIDRNYQRILDLQKMDKDQDYASARRDVQLAELRSGQSGLAQKIEALSASVSDDLVGTAAVVHAIDSVNSTLQDIRDKIGWLMHDSTSPLVLASHYLYLLQTLLSDVLQKILDKLISIDNQVGGFVGLFKNFRDDFTGFVLNIRQDVANFQKGVLTGLLAACEWLEAIYHALLGLKPPDTSQIHLPPSDGDGGSGTNIWDVLKQLIESLGTIVGKLVDALSKLADLFSQLFVPKDLSFISDTFDSISGKFNKKFAIVTDFGSALKGMFSSRHSLKDFSLSFAGSSVVVPLSMVSGLVSTVRPLLTGLFVLLTVIGLYRRFTDGEVVS